MTKVIKLTGARIDFFGSNSDRACAVYWDLNAA